MSNIKAKISAPVHLTYNSKGINVNFREIGMGGMGKYLKTIINRIKEQ
jgi:hypothetical protein